MTTAICKAAPDRVLVCQLGPKRDALFSIPLAVDMRDLWPNATIHWIVESNVDELLQSHSCIDKVTRIDRGWLRRPQHWQQLKASLRQQRYDVAVDTVGLSKSALLGWLAGAATRIGFAYPLGREIAPWLATHRIQVSARHRVDAIRQLLSVWQETPNGMGRYQMPHFADSEAWVDNLTRQNELLSGNGWISIHPGAMWPAAHWPVERFGVVAEELFRKHGLRSVVLWTDEHERLLSQVIAENSRGGAVVAPQTSVPQLAELLRKSKFLLTGDSDPLQIASSLGTPCISLHGPSWADEVGAYGADHIAIQSPLPNFSRRISRRGPNSAMQAIEIDEVLYHCDRMIYRLERRDRPMAA